MRRFLYEKFKDGELDENQVRAKNARTAFDVKVNELDRKTSVARNAIQVNGQIHYVLYYLNISVRKENDVFGDWNASINTSTCCYLYKKVVPNETTKYK